MNFRFTATSALLIAALAAPAFSAPLTHSDRPMPRPANFHVEGTKAPSNAPRNVSYTPSEMAAIARYTGALDHATTPAQVRALRNPTHPLHAKATAAARAAVNRAAQGSHVAPHTRGENAAINRYRAALAAAKTPRQRAAVRNGRLGVDFINAIDARNMRTFEMSQRNALRPGQHMNRNGTALDDKNNQADD